MARCKLLGAVRLPRVKTELKKSEQVTWEQEGTKNQIAEVEILQIKVEKILTQFKVAESLKRIIKWQENFAHAQQVHVNNPQAVKISALEGLLVKKLGCKVDN